MRQREKYDVDIEYCRRARDVESVIHKTNKQINSETQKISKFIFRYSSKLRHHRHSRTQRDQSFYHGNFCSKSLHMLRVCL